MTPPRASGILLHPTSLPGPGGIGDLGRAAYEFVDFLQQAKQTYWQILPLGPTGWGDSPYSSFSAFAGNTLLIADENPDTDEQLPHDGSPVDYGAVYEAKDKMLRDAYERFKSADEDVQAEFDRFVTHQSGWLDDYASYRAIRNAQGGRPWFEWDEPLKLRDAEAIGRATDELSEEIRTQKYFQFLFFKQWSSLRRYANEKQIKIVGDIPIFVALDSADVWRDREQFKLNEDGSPMVVSGVPPDFFSRTGQLWGNPIYDWDHMQSDGFRWWIERIRHTLSMVDVVRIDHFRGFEAAWEVPGGNATAEHGDWVKAPGKALFEAVRGAIGELSFWVEDLGFMTPEVDELRDGFNFPGMRILQFAFGGDAHNQALPHNYIRNCIAYTGTHDNDTTAGWWAALAEDNPARQHCIKYVGTDGAEISWEMMRAVWASVADTAIAPLQDVLGLGNDARMNTPATTSGNWSWRLKNGDLTEEVAERLRELTETYGRAG